MNPADRPVATRELTREEIAERSIAAITARWPGVLAWLGKKTGRCWAYVPRPVPQLLEADTWGELSAKIADVSPRR